MSSYEQVLRTALSKYKSPDVAKRDVLNVFSAFKDLHPKLDDYVFNDGTKKSLLQLDGTIPVSYKGATYNIPIAIWLMDTHPYNPPMVYVRPTNTMQIKPSRNVDTNGKVDLPYLREWRYPNSDLLGMIQILTIVFGEEPPVFSRAQAPPRPQYPPQGQTPYPAGGSSFPMPMPGVNQPGNYPGYPGGSTGYPPANPGSYPGQSFGGYPPQGGYPGPGTAGYPQSTTGYPSNTPYPTSYPQNSTASSYPQTNTATPDFARSTTVTEEHLKASLLSAVEDKLKRRMKEIFSQAQAEMDVLYKTQADLLKGKEKLEQMIKDLEKEKSDTESNTHLLKQKDQEVKEALSRLEKQDTLSIDDAVVTPAPLYRQLLNAYAEEQAIEDAVYYLGEALRKDVVDLDVFLKKVRDLSRKQFMLRALIQKCREKAGLPPLS